MPTSPKPYRENEDFVPNPTDQFGTLDTSDTAGAAHSDLNAVSPIFKVAANEGAIQAARALDPKDDSVSPSLVILPGDDGVDRETAIKGVNERAKDAEKVKGGDILNNRTTDVQAQAAETGGDNTESTKSATNSQGGTDGSGTGTTPAKKTASSSSK